MAIYEFRCPECGRVIELRRNIGDYVAYCPECGAPMAHNPVNLYARTDWL